MLKRVFCLSVHAAYTCRHSGACCEAGWQIPVEAEVRRGVHDRGIRPRSGTAGPLFVTPDASSGNGAAVTARRPNGACVFFEPGHGRLCAIHREAGPAMLPSACRHFPRVVLRDARGTFVTLSHFCPTAAALLSAPADLAVVDAPPCLSLGGALEGLDATAVLPPLLRPGLLTDLDGYAAWERAGIAVLNRRDLRAADAVDLLAAATRGVCEWRPETGPLCEHVSRTFSRHAGYRPAPREPMPDDHAARAFIAAHLFANWIAYQGTGLEDVVHYLRDVLARLTREMAALGSFVEAARAVDLRLRHGTAAGSSG